MNRIFRWNGSLVQNDERLGHMRAGIGPQLAWEIENSQPTPRTSARMDHRPGRIGQKGSETMKTSMRTGEEQEKIVRREKRRGKNDEQGREQSR